MISHLSDGRMGRHPGGPHDGVDVVGAEEEAGEGGSATTLLRRTRSSPHRSPPAQG